jgi:hypothetical protein
MLSEPLKKINVVCPICKTQNIINLPSKIINNASRLTAISVPKGKICRHQFQLFIDKNFSIRGYQKVDYEVNKDNSAKLKTNFVSSLELYSSSKNENTKIEIPHAKLKKMDYKTRNLSDLERIYNEFWDVIDDDNLTFHELILKDKRRKAAMIIENLQKYDVEFEETLQNITN